MATQGVWLLRGWILLSHMTSSAPCAPLSRVFSDGDSRFNQSHLSPRSRIRQKRRHKEHAAVSLPRVLVWSMLRETAQQTFRVSDTLSRWSGASAASSDALHPLCLLLVRRAPHNYLRLTRIVDQRLIQANDLQLYHALDSTAK